MDDMHGDRAGRTGGAWEDMLDGLSGAAADDRSVLDRAHALARRGGRLAVAMDVIADAVRGLDRSRGPCGWAHLMLADTPVSMDAAGSVPDMVPRIITMVAFSSMAMAVIGSSAQHSSAYGILPSGVGRRWGYDGPDVTPGFVRSMITGGWVQGMTERERFEPPPACMVELVACMTGGEGPSVYDISRAYRMQTVSDLSRGMGVSPGVSLPMDVMTLGMTAGLRARMGPAWPVVPDLLWEDGPYIPSMDSVRFAVVAMDWKRPPPADGMRTVFDGFLDVFSDGDVISLGMFSGHLLLSWAASLHDQPMMAAAPEAARVADRLLTLAFRAGMKDGLPVPMLRGLAAMPDMPDGFLMETMKAAGTP